MTASTVALILSICSLVITLGIVVFLWWQFNFIDSRLCRLIEERSGVNLLEDEDIFEDDISEEEEE